MSAVERSGAPEDVELGIDVRRGDPDAAELAALIAVVTEAYAVEAAGAVVEDRPVRTAWEVSARSLRRPVDRDLGWGSFRV